MFFYTKRIEEKVFSVGQLENPVNPHADMVLGFYRTYAWTAFFRMYNKNAAPLYWDLTNNKTIPKRKWTGEMHALVNQMEHEVPAAPYRFKLTIVGYIMTLFFIGFFAYLTYDSIRPKPSYADQVTPIQETPKAGDMYFGRFETMKPGERVASKVGFGWFKVIENNQGQIKVAMNKNMSSHHKPSKELNSTDYEEQSIDATITSQESFQLNLISSDNLTEMYFTEKK